MLCCPRYEGGVRRECVCWRFGTGICTPIDEIPNFEKYTQLIQDVNSDNFDERYRLYWKDLGQNISDERLENRLQALRQHEAQMNLSSESPIYYSIFMYAGICFIIVLYIYILTQKPTFPQWNIIGMSNFVYYYYYESIPLFSY